jgi:DNA-binding transcriptional LysR family regulator
VSSVIVRILSREYTLSTHMELRHLRYFLAVAQELNFGRAAQKLRIAQPPLSQQIRALEQELGVELFSRSKHKVELTRAGADLAKEAAHILSRVRRMEEQASLLSQGQTGTLVISSGPTIMATVLRRSLPAFTQRYPKVSMEFRDYLSARSLTALKEGTVDVGFVVPPSRTDGLSTEEVLTEPIVAALPTNHALANRKELALGELAEEPFITLSTRVAQGYRDQVIAYCREEGFEPKMLHETTSIWANLLLVETGVGVTLLPSSARTVFAHRIAYIPLSSPAASIKYVVAWRRDNRSPALHAFLDVVRDGWGKEFAERAKAKSRLS